MACNPKTESTTHQIAFWGAIFFAYTLTVGLSLQLYVIPEVFPQFDRGEGIVILDSTGFNQVAKTKAAEIKQMGWQAWELRPQNFSPAGIASIFYVLWVDKPYSVLPFNALIHAASGGVVLWLLRIFFPWRPAIFGSIFFVANPASLEWVAQIHRDGVYILGLLMVLLCLVLFHRGLKTIQLRSIIGGFLFGMVGTSFVWVARPYWVQVLLTTVVIGVLMISLCHWMTRTK